MALADSVPSAYLFDARALATAGATLRHGVGDLRATCQFSFASLPEHYGFLVMAGVEDALQALEHGSPSSEELQAVRSCVPGIESILERLAVGPLRVDIDAAPDGTIVFAHEPIVTVEGRYADVLVVMSVLRACITRATAVATRTMRRVLAAGGNSIVDGSSLSRDHHSAECVARAAYIGGADATTSLLAGLRLGLPICTLADDAVYSGRDPLGLGSDGWGESDTLVAIDQPNVEMALLARQGSKPMAGQLLFRDLDVPALLSAQIDLVALEKNGAWTPHLGVNPRPIQHPGRALLVRYVDEQASPTADVIHAANERIQPAVSARLVGENGVARPLSSQTVRGGPFTLALWRGGRRVGAVEELARIRHRARAGVAALPADVRLLHSPDVYPVGLSPQLAEQKAEMLALVPALP